MREILFRAKGQTSDKWYEGLLTRLDQGVCHIKDNRHNEWVCDSETVCQYTGLTDKNGRKIFEGDIVRAIYKPKDEDLTIDDFIIKWDKYYCKYVGHYARKENVYNPLLFGSQTSFEVIGNKFDDPELIGVAP